ncbi:MAG: hypothetical protein HKP19_12055 [Xanthomonadales bacterium]|nr:hypothetical protein [Xanthomonadales bacterium]
MKQGTTDSQRRQGAASLVVRAMLLVLLAGLATPVLSAVELRIDRDRVMVGETVTLTFTADNTDESLETDLSVLEEDFEILDSRREQQLSIVGGRQTAMVRLLLTVEPKRDGDIQIPSFRFGDSRTRPVLLRVEPAPELAEGELPPVFIEVEVTPGDGPYYVHAQFGLVVRVLYHPNLTEAAISQPEPAPASVRLLEETPYQAERGGKRYRVLERHYAVFPERSGELVVPAMELSGRLLENRPGDIWKQSVRGRRVRAASEEIRLQVEPRAEAFTGDDWQPARKLKVSQQISSGDTLRVGEPVTRTVMVDAVGLEENMIVEPTWPPIENARIYPDQPQGITRDDGRWVLGHKEFRYAVVPEQPGELVLPEVRVDWWDTQADEQRLAVLPEQRLAVMPADLAPPAAAALPPVPDQAASLPAADAGKGSELFWKGMALAFALMWLATLLLVWRLLARVRAPSGLNGTEAVESIDGNALLKAFRNACRNGDPASARRALQRWLARHETGGQGSVLEFAAGTGDPDLRLGLYDLDARGFKPGVQGDWDGKMLWRLFEGWRTRKLAAAAGERAPLTDLYAPENRVNPGG